MRWFLILMVGLVGLALLLTAFAATLYYIFPDSKPMVQFAFLPGALVTWTIWGDDFRGETEFNGRAISVSYFVNAFIGATVGVTLALLRFAPKNFALRTLLKAQDHAR